MNNDDSFKLRWSYLLSAGRNKVIICYSMKNTVRYCSYLFSSPISLSNCSIFCNFVGVAYLRTPVASARVQYHDFYTEINIIKHIFKIK